MPKKVWDTNELKDKIFSCSRSALNDLNKIRRSSTKSMYGQDPAVPHLRGILDGSYYFESRMQGKDELSGLQSGVCYAVSNLRNWSASKLYKDKESDLFRDKNKEIKECKTLFKKFCDRKLSYT